MPFLLPNQQHQSTEGTLIIAKTHKMLNLNKHKKCMATSPTQKIKNCCERIILSYTAQQAADLIIFLS